MHVYVVIAVAACIQPTEATPGQSTLGKNILGAVKASYLDRAAFAARACHYVCGGCVYNMYSHSCPSFFAPRAELRVVLDAASSASG